MGSSGLTSEGKVYPWLDGGASYIGDNLARLSPYLEIGAGDLRSELSQATACWQLAALPAFEAGAGAGKSVILSQGWCNGWTMHHPFRWTNKQS